MDGAALEGPARTTAKTAAKLSDRTTAVAPPQAFPYQGSKRHLAGLILSEVGPKPRRLVEPFAGSAAVSLAAAHSLRCSRFWLNDSLSPLTALWREIIERPDELANDYERLWSYTDTDSYEHIRAEFNVAPRPAALLYLLCRCVKAAVRFNAAGGFNQSADRRRLGARPHRVRARLLAVSRLLQGRTELSSDDFLVVLDKTKPDDFVYLDPPYQGTSGTRDRRYAAGLSRARVIEGARLLVARGVPFALSYDGRSGDKSYGEPLAEELGLVPRWLAAGVSSQGTLSGERRETVEALYVSSGLEGPRGSFRKRKS